MDGNFPAWFSGEDFCHLMLVALMKKCPVIPSEVLLFVKNQAKVKAEDVINSSALDSQRSWMLLEDKASGQKMLMQLDDIDDILDKGNFRVIKCYKA